MIECNVISTLESANSNLLFLKLEIDFKLPKPGEADFSPLSCCLALFSFDSLVGVVDMLAALALFTFESDTVDEVDVDDEPIM